MRELPIVMPKQFGPCDTIGRGHDWPFALCTGGYERGARGMTIAIIAGRQ